ncbi:RrF2 family transcriptional regulator [Entomobacter blattae]|uniref:HTH-type transcriptional regulator IscR n=1 Tax=Entomobacter blattae TaxID=2762277 RepID=A0A7H1NUP7_9PROT|nr:Rrf2 family transcriptional regulator [Entomobacter blattae]QNT79507.1 HTH-type transcriptional regulator IscR [Entomobacter blattae]
MLLRRDRMMLSVLIMLDVAFYAGSSSTVSAPDIAQRANLARRGIEPLLQTLSRAQLLDSTRGPKGGYSLPRPARDIFLTEIFEAVMADDTHEKIHTDEPLFQQVVIPFWQGMETTLQKHIKNVTLGDLLKKASQEGLVRPISEPITFSI